ncbi:laminin EGF domain-containing protein [Vespula squamosa]|uniref:Laminin EGF domain-containing protein n=1 Tax=Vespula squamosa TaxID=30214 RepID=A0ABD2A816_VESSQ
MREKKEKRWQEARAKPVQLQPPREKVQIQHGTLQAVGPCQRRRLPAVPAFYGRKALSLLPRRLLQGSGEADHASQGLQTTRDRTRTIGYERRIHSPPPDNVRPVFTQTTVAPSGKGCFSNSSIGQQSETFAVSLRKLSALGRLFRSVKSFDISASRFYAILDRQG